MNRNEIARWHAKTNSYIQKLEQARKIIDEVRYMCCENGTAIPYVSLSGGKDSTVVYDLALNGIGNLPAVWSDDEWWLPETLEYIQRLQKARHDVRQIRTNDQHTEWLHIAGDYDGIPDYAARQGWNMALLGLRQEESNIRRMHLRQHGSIFFAQSDKMWHCNPIHNWTWKDVWAYIISNNIDYNHAYDRLEEIGVEPERQRIGPLAVERVLGYGQMVILKRGWPELFERFCASHPEARNYV